MKTSIIIILALCLAVSLWINREQQQHPLMPQKGSHSSEPYSPPKAEGAPATAALPNPGTMDFSGTAFSDEAWKLDNHASVRSEGLSPEAPAAISPGDSASYKLELPTSLPSLDTPDTNAPAGTTKSFRSLLTTPDER